MTLQLQIIKLLESGFDNAQIQEQLGVKMHYISIVKKMMKDSGAKVDRYYRKKPKAGTKSDAVYKTFLENPKARAVDVSKALGVTRSLCRKVRTRYFGLPTDPAEPVKLKRQILPQPKAMFDVDLSELSL